MAVTDFTKLVPGFDFLQNLVKGAGGAMPGLGQWIAPTLDAEEVDKRIQELRTVQFWLEQNARLLGATIQALEVQRMTLATLKTMNLPMADLRESFKIDPMKAFVPTAARAEPEPEAEAEADPEPEAQAPPAAPALKPPRAPARKAPARKPSAVDAAANNGSAAAPAAVDPLQWWGALTRQFTELATQAIKDTPVEAATQAATQLAGAALKTAAAPAKAAGRAVRGAAAVGRAARKGRSAGAKR